MNGVCSNHSHLSNHNDTTLSTLGLQEKGLKNGVYANGNSSLGFMPFDRYKKERQGWIEYTRQQVFDWDFDMFKLSRKSHGNPLVTMTLSLLEEYQLMEGWKLRRETIENFLLKVEAGYNQNSYHNNIHAADVTQTSAIIMQSVLRTLGSVSQMELFCIIMASVIHDLGHLGVNNDFLINSRHPRATTYNDRSVNENYHVSKAFEVARTTAGCDIFEHFTPDEQKQCRRLIIDIVLATDMAIHFDLLSQFNTATAASADYSTWADKNLIYRMVVHLADIANPSRPFNLARAWAERVVQEMCEQGDAEVKAGLPLSPMCSRENVNMPRSQRNFIEIFVRPTLQVLEGVAPEFVRMALRHLDRTVDEWKALEELGVRM